MPQVDSAFSAWLKAPALYVVSTSATATAAYGDQTADTVVISPLAIDTDAQAESDRQLAFLAGPIVRDTLTVYGLRSDLIGQLIRAKGESLGYEGAGALAFVVGAAEQEGPRMTILKVIKKLVP